MPIYNLYSKRKKAASRAGQPDVYVYDNLPGLLRKQIALVWRDAIGPYETPGEFMLAMSANANPYWDEIDAIMTREVEGFHDLLPDGDDPDTRCVRFLQRCPNVDECLDLIEATCVMMASFGSGFGSDPRQESRGSTISGQDGIAEINARFREHGVGYQFENGSIIRVDGQFTHAEVIKPALALLAEKGFEKADEDFMTAHRHLRHREEKDAITAANRAFESTLKAICAMHKWQYEKGARASDLIKVVRQHGLLPDYLDEGLTTFIAMMKTGLPKVRDNAGGHGSAPDAPTVTAHLATYAISMAAANIRLVIEAHKAKR